jgi:ATP-dependent DNA helicase RecG
MTDAITARTELDAVPGLNRRLAERLREFGLHTAGDLVRHFPMRHERSLAQRTIAQASREVADEPAVLRVRGTVAAVRVSRGRAVKVEATLEDDSGAARLVWFNAGWMRDRIHPGDSGAAEGRAKMHGDHLELTNARWMPDRADAPSAVAAHDEAAREDRLRAVYPASERLLSSEIAFAVAKVLEPVCAAIEDPLPEDFRAQRQLVPLPEAYRRIHDARSEDDVAAARRRLAFDELFLLQLGVMMRRSQLRSRTRALALPLTAAIDAHIRGRIPFTLTAEQDRVVGEIARDMARPHAMNRLLQGDVGSGKTAVAAYAMLLAVAHGHQAALVAPTELLAEQHFEVLGAMLQGSQVRLAFVSGSNTAAQRARRVTGLASGAFDIAIGTHAVLEGGVAFRSLAVAVIDEQHRFGVKQRAAIRQKGRGEMPLIPHTLVMTATPIPRTLAITLYGDLDASSLRGAPPGRGRVATRVVGPEKSPEVYAYLRRRIEQGEQAYVVVPAIEESDRGLKDVTNHLRFLQEGPWRGLAIAPMHGAMPREEREAAMSAFRGGEVRALVATTVIEVGVDVANASLMVVEHAERFGLAQLHQLRGRVGRGSAASLCVFIGEATTADGKERLRAIAETDDGFAIAETDLRIADLARDEALLAQARRDAQEWIERDPDLAAPHCAALRRKLMAAYGEALGLGDVG